MPTIKEAIEENLKKIRKNLRYKKIKASAVDTAIYGSSKLEGLFTKQESVQVVNRPLDEVSLYDCAEEMKVLCASHTNSAKTIVDVFAEVVNVLNEQYNLHVDLKVPKFNFRNSIERQLFILKYFQDNNSDRTINDLRENYLWMYTDESIKEDIKAIQSDNLSFLGKKIEIKFDRNHDTVKVESSAHPIILVENLTQILIQLKGLEEMAKNAAFKIYAEITAVNIWNQLSEYGQKRIIEVLEDYMGESAQWIKSLEDRGEDDLYFFSEHACSNIKGTGNALMYFKNGNSFWVRYENENDEIEIREVKFVYPCRDIFHEPYHLIDVNTDEEIYIPQNRILNTGENREDFVNIPAEE